MPFEDSPLLRRSRFALNCGQDVRAPSVAEL